MSGYMLGETNALFFSDRSNCTYEWMDDTQHEIFTKWLLHVEDLFAHWSLESLFEKQNSVLTNTSALLKVFHTHIDFVCRKRSRLVRLLQEKETTMTSVRDEIQSLFQLFVVIEHHTNSSIQLLNRFFTSGWISNYLVFQPLLETFFAVITWMFTLYINYPTLSGLCVFGFAVHVLAQFVSWHLHLKLSIEITKVISTVQLILVVQSIVRIIIMKQN